MSANSYLSILKNGEISLEGQFLWGSNYTLLTKVRLEEHEIDAVYKPIRGERPLWDFPRASLAKREVAAYLVSEMLGWKMVPPTIYRESGPLGAGSLQLFVEHDPEYHYFNFRPQDRQRLGPVVLFDVLINNADRKGGHVIIDRENRLWLIDHGVCFHEEPKLRTVIWDFAGQNIPDELCRDIQRFREKLTPPSEPFDTLGQYLSPRELAALVHRTDQLLAARVFPYPPEHSRPYPWPLV